MKDFHGSASARVDAPPQAVYDLITDVGRLPEWNAAIEAGSGDLRRWQKAPSGPSRCVRLTYRRGGVSPGLRRLTDPIFASPMRRATLDGNPSYTKWAWAVVDTGDSAEVSVSWDVYLKTLDRRILAGPLRKRQLEREVSKSLTAVSNSVTAVR